MVDTLFFRHRFRINCSTIGNKHTEYQDIQPIPNIFLTHQHNRNPPLLLHYGNINHIVGGELVCTVGVVGDGSVKIFPNALDKLSKLDRKFAGGKHRQHFHHKHIFTAVICGVGNVGSVWTL